MMKLRCYQLLTNVTISESDPLKVTASGPVECTDEVDITDEDWCPACQKRFSLCLSLLWVYPLHLCSRQIHSLLP